MASHPSAGKPAPRTLLTNIPRLVANYFSLASDPAEPARRVAFGTSGHRGCCDRHSFNQAHILAISRALAEYRRGEGIDGPLFIGMDTHAPSEPALISAVEVLAAAEDICKICAESFRGPDHLRRIQQEAPEIAAAALAGAAV